MSNLRPGFDRHASARVLFEGRFSPDVAGAFCAVMIGGAAIEHVGRRWSGGRVLCPRCGCEG
eukprot:6476265-Lingulodinium_polyedra.AAC.1